MQAASAGTQADLPPPRALIVYAHPQHQHSYGNRELLAAVQGLEQVTVHDLYEEYPDFHIDVAREQALLLSHDLIIFQFPLYWYSAPALLKEWQDRVFDFGFAYGQNVQQEQQSQALAGKALWLAVTAGGPVNSFREEGISRRPLSDYLLPFEQSAALCDMRYLEPFAVYRIRKLTKPYLQERAEEYRAALLQHLRDLNAPHPHPQENADA